MDSLKISIIVPVYKSEQYLDKCMRSILNNTFTDIEVILIDDGSPDGSKCDEYALEDKRVRIFRHEVNKGLSAARNEGVRQATSPYISFVDSDDWIMPSALEDMYRLAQTHNADIVSCGVAEYQGGRPRNSETVDSDTVITMDGKEALKRSLIADPTASHTAWGKLYRAEIFDGITYPEGRIHEDAATTYLLYSKASKVVHVKKPLYCYAFNNEGISNSGFKPTSMNKLIAADEIIDYVRKNCSENLDHALCFKVVLALRLAADLTSKNAKKFPEQYQQVRAVLHNPSNARNKLLSSRHRLLLWLYKYCRPAFDYVWKKRLGAR